MQLAAFEFVHLLHFTLSTLICCAIKSCTKAFPLLTQCIKMQLAHRCGHFYLS